eukprot:243928-Pleurochrysis_carterae.AAC.4
MVQMSRCEVTRPQSHSSGIDLAARREQRCEFAFSLSRVLVDPFSDLRALEAPGPEDVGVECVGVV